jgi:2-haloacid dehalogenase
MDMTQSRIDPVPKLILLDVYQTLLDLSDIERRVNALLDSKRGFDIWFERFMQYCFVDNCTAQFHDFLSIAHATLEMSLIQFDRKSGIPQIDDVLERLKHLPLHDGVSEGLSLLIDKGFRLAALTNAPHAVVMDRMERTGLISYFENVLYAEQVGKYKPCLEVYEWAAKSLGTAPSEVLLVSSHGWDLAGAAQAGMQTAYLRRERQSLYPLAAPPLFSCNDLADLARQF